MFKRVISRRKLNNKISSQAASWWSGMLLEPFKYFNDKQIKYKIKRDNTLSLEQVMIFEDVLRDKIRKGLSGSQGLMTFSTNDDILKDSALAAHIPNFPEDYFPKEAKMSIESYMNENKPEIYVYIGGATESEKVR